MTNLERSLELVKLEIGDELSGFLKNPAQRRKALHNKTNAVEKMIEKNNIKGAIHKLKHDIKDKLQKWLIDYEKVDPLQLSKDEVINLVKEIIYRIGLQI